MLTERQLVIDHERAYEIFKQEVLDTLSAEMKDKKISSEKIGKVIGVSPSTIRMLRSGSSAGNFFTIASSLYSMGVSVDTLIQRVSKKCHDKGILWPAIQ